MPYQFVNMRPLHFGGAFLFKQIIMKKVILVLAIGLFSCQKEEVKPIVKNCGCDRIVNIVRAKYSFPGQQNTFWATITTVNDCSNWQKQYTYESNYSAYSKKEGECH